MHPTKILLRTNSRVELYRRCTVGTSTKLVTGMCGNTFQTNKNESIITSALDLQSIRNGIRSEALSYTCLNPVGFKVHLRLSTGPANNNELFDGCEHTSPSGSSGLLALARSLERQHFFRNAI